MNGSRQFVDAIHEAVGRVGRGHQFIMLTVEIACGDDDGPG